MSYFIQMQRFFYRTSTSSNTISPTKDEIPSKALPSAFTSTTLAFLISPLK